MYQTPVTVTTPVRKKSLRLRRVEHRPGTAELLVEIRKETLAEIDLHEFEQGAAAEPTAESTAG